MPVEYYIPESACDDVDAIYSEDYADYIIQYFANIQMLIERYNLTCYQGVNIQQAVIYERVENEDDFGIQRYGYMAFPKCYGLMDLDALEETGVLRLRRQPYLDLLGRDVIIGFVDTGIEYTHPAFINADNTSRILSIWDQNIRGGMPVEGYLFGTEYRKEDIDAALASENPLEVVPSTDTNGHGTFMAGVAAGNEISQSDFSGVAPLADIIVVKLKEAKLRYRNYYQIPEGVPCYQENDIMMGISYILRRAVELNKTVVVCLGVGTNSGDHEGNGHLGMYINTISGTTGMSVVAPGGNETGFRHHYQGNDVQSNNYEDVEINVGPGESGFTMELWARTPNLFSVGILSPSGEYSNKIAARINESRFVDFLLERSTVQIDFEIIESGSGDQLIFMRFNEPDPGIWKLRVYNDGQMTGDYNIWLPIRGFVNDSTFFNNPSPDTIICEPGNAEGSLTMAGYNTENQSIYTNSSRGFTRKGRIKPDLTAPAVNVFGPELGGRYGLRTGTSVSAALAAGISALMREWLNEQDVELTGDILKSYLIKGAERGNLAYPNREWGYGKINIFNTFQSLRTTLQ